MKTQILKLTTAATLACGLLMATVLAGYGATPNWVFVDEFDDGIINRSWRGPYGGPNAWMAEATETNGQFTIQVDWPATNPDNPGTTIVDWYLLPKAPPIADGETLEITADMVSVNQDDAYGYIGMDSDPGGGYGFLKDQNELCLFKFGGGAITWIFWEEQEIKNTNVTLVLALTRDGSSLVIQTRVLDLENGNQILWEKTVIDTPASDPVLPNRSVKGLLMQPDIGAPWFGEVGNTVYFGLWQFNSGDDGPAEVVYDRFEASEFDMALTLAKSASPDELMLSWPRTGVEHVVFESDSCEGPWELLPLPIQNDGEMNWVTIPAVASEKYFRLVQGHQFHDDFSGMYPPWTPLGPSSYDPSKYTYTYTNRSLWIQCDQEGTAVTRGQVALLWSETNVLYRDVVLAMDILDWDESASDQVIGLGGRAGDTWGDAWCLGTLTFNEPDFGGRAQLAIVFPEVKTPVDLDPQKAYRLIFSLMGNHQELSLFELGAPDEPVASVRTTNTTLVDPGTVAVWINPNWGNYDVTVSDFTATAALDGLSTP